jgi:DNA ligase-1
MTQKTFAEAIFSAEQHSKQQPKFEALTGLNDESLKLVVEALSPYRVFGVKKFDFPKTYAQVDPATYQEFFTLLDALHERAFTGNAARSYITTSLSKFTENTAKALSRVLLKDLKCGASPVTFEKIYPNLVIPKFELMGAEKMAKDYKWKFPCIVESKYDGLRLIAIVKTNTSKAHQLVFGNQREVTYYSRSGKPSDYVVGLFDEELSNIADYLGYDIIVDGEALGDSFQETMNAKGSDNKEAKDKLKFMAFDIMPLCEWSAQSCSLPQIDRSILLEYTIEQVQAKKICKSEYKIVDTYDDAKTFYELMLHKGYEGLIIKYTDGKYQWNMGAQRGPEWTKWKPVMDVDLKIVGFFEGAKDTKNEGKLGAFLLEGQDENGNKISTNCGGIKVSDPRLSSLVESLAKKEGVDLKAKDSNGKPVTSKDQFFREYVYSHQAEFYGKMCLVEAQELTKAEGSTTYALRFPQFVCMRPDKD